LVTSWDVENEKTWQENKNGEVPFTKLNRKVEFFDGFIDENSKCPMVVWTCGSALFNEIVAKLQIWIVYLLGEENKV
jgi:hypothetical protein